VRNVNGRRVHIVGVVYLGYTRVILLFFCSCFRCNRRWHGHWWVLLCIRFYGFTAGSSLHLSNPLDNFPFFLYHRFFDRAFFFFRFRIQRIIPCIA
jgi:hypothetical protein